MLDGLLDFVRQWGCLLSSGCTALVTECNNDRMSDALRASSNMTSKALSNTHGHFVAFWECSAHS